MTDPQIFESMAALQTMLAEHVKGWRREQARLLRKQSAHYRQLALQCYGDIEEAARLEGMGDGFAIAADMVDAPKLEAVT